MNIGSKRETGIAWFVGFPPDDEESIKEDFKQKFLAYGNTKLIAAYERPKTAEEQEMITYIIAKMPAFIEKWGGIPINGITPNHIHILEKAKITGKDREALKDSRTGASYVAMDELVFVLDSGNNLKNAFHVVHELIHFHSFQSIHVVDPKEKKFYIRRVGFEVHGLQEFSFFRDINEAITVELQKRFDAEYFTSTPVISADVERRNAIKEHAKGKADDLALIDKGEMDGQGQTRFSLEYHTYSTERKRLNEIMEAIQQEYPETFSFKEEVFAVFTKAALSGRLLSVARLIENTFGKGAFRKLGQETRPSK